MKFSLCCLAALLSTNLPLPAGETPSLPELKAEGAVSWEQQIIVGYDSHYVFRGETLQENVGWAQWVLEIPLSESVALNFNPWFYQDLDSNFNKCDLNLALSVSLGTYEVTAAYNGYYYPHGGSGNGLGVRDEQELALSVAHDLWSLKATALAVYNIGRDGYYFEALLEQPYEFNDTFSVKLGVAVGFDSGYFAKGTGLNHVQTILSFPIKLSEKISLQPYVAGNIPVGNHLDYEDARIFGGIQLGISF